MNHLFLDLFDTSSGLWSSHFVSDGCDIFLLTKTISGRRICLCLLDS